MNALDMAWQVGNWDQNSSSEGWMEISEENDNIKAMTMQPPLLCPQHAMGVAGVSALLSA